MAWGYEKSFTIEHIEGLKRKLSCKDCQNYISSDMSCSKRPLYLPEDGYNSWRGCKFFELDENVTHLDEKKAQLLRTKNARSIKKDQPEQLKPTNYGYKVGDKITHKKFGRGEIIAKDKNMVTVRFTTPGGKSDNTKSVEKKLDLGVCVKNGLISTLTFLSPRYPFSCKKNRSTVKSNAVIIRHIMNTYHFGAIINPHSSFAKSL